MLVAEPMAGAPGAPRMGDAYFGFYLLAMGSGRSRTAADLAALMQAAGFTDIAEVDTALPIQVGVLRARKATVPAAAPTQAPDAATGSSPV